MFNFTKSKAAVAGALMLAIVGGSATAASAAIVPAPSSDEMYLWDSSETLVSETRSVGWGEQVLAYPKNTDFAMYDTYFQGPSNAQAVYVFLSPRGQELAPTNWVSKAMNGFADPTAKTVLTPQLTPENTAGVNLATAKANGGQFSLGIAYTDQNATVAYGVTFINIDVAPGGSYTYSATEEEAVDPCIADPSLCPVGESADIDITAGVIEADGTLTLTVPNTSVTLGAPAINAEGLSEANGSVTGIQVDDTRKTADREGWNLTQSVENFVSGANTIDKKQFGVTPAVVSTTQGATPAPAQIAGSAVYPSPFAEAGAGTTTGTSTLLSAGLKLIAPAGTPAGTYTSTMTLTLVSK